ncbi:glycosyltransferase family 2 protein [Candidatus Peregrinibacteria bacterium]|nr:glycosyltransferase family 2 protein [Candidatus Peregrinibacteria bacterium]
MQPLVSVLVLNYRTPGQTVFCVQNLLEQTIAQKMEIIVIDNHSQDDSIGVFRNRLGNVRIVETPHNLGFGAGYNYGARYAHGLSLLINNPAKILRHDALAELVHSLDQDPSIGIIAPQIFHADGSRRSAMRSFPTPLDILIKRTLLKNIFPHRLAHYLRLDADPLQQQETDWVIGGCFLIRRELFSNIRGFDERFFLFFEDIDLCRRVHMTNQRVMYNPSATAVDKKERLSGEGFWDLILSQTGRTHLISAGKYFWKWGMTP